MKTKTRIQQQKEKRNNKIIELWEQFYVDGETQKTALAEDIAGKVGVSLSTVQRIVKL